MWHTEEAEGGVNLWRTLPRTSLELQGLFGAGEIGPHGLQRSFHLQGPFCGGCCSHFKHSVCFPSCRRMASKQPVWDCVWYECSLCPLVSICTTLSIQQNHYQVIKILKLFSQREKSCIFNIFFFWIREKDNNAYNCFNEVIKSVVSLMAFRVALE